MQKDLLEITVAALEQLKGVDITVLDVAGKTSITDRMVIASGNSERHVSSLADNVIREAKHHDQPPIGVEGQRAGEWVLVDLGDVVVHVMLPRVREFYQLEKLWSAELDADEPQGDHPGLPRYTRQA